MKRLIILALACAALTVPALTAAAQAPPIPANQQPHTEEGALTGAAETPLRDLNMIKDKTPPLLIETAKAPYARIGPRDCAGMRAQIEELDKVLGPDIDSPDFGKDGKGFFASAAGDALHVPFAGVVRKISGAEKARQLEDRQILAGYARRSYLKGTLSACEGPRIGRPMRTSVATPPAMPMPITPGAMPPPN